MIYAGDATPVDACSKLEPKTHRRPRRTTDMETGKQAEGQRSWSGEEWDLLIRAKGKKNGQSIQCGHFCSLFDLQTFERRCFRPRLADLEKRHDPYTTGVQFPGSRLWWTVIVWGLA